MRACAALIVALALAGCGGGGDSAKEFRFNLASGLGSLDPAQMGSVSAGIAGIQLFDGLVRLDTAGNVAPALASHWRVSDDGTEYRFSLRRDVRFHDDPCFPGGKGRTVSAADVKFSFERICDPRTKSTGWWMFHDRVVGADAFHDSLEHGVTLTGVAGFVVEGDSVFILRLTTPFAPMLAMLTMPYAFVMPCEASDKYGAELFQHPVGTGTFRLDHWTPDVELVLARVPDDWHGARGTIERVSVTFAKDVKTEFLEFSRGTRDLALAVPPGFEEDVFDSSGALHGKYAAYHLLSLPALTTEYYGILLDPSLPGGAGSPLAANVLLRRALNCAVDREALVRYVLRGQAIPAHGVLPPGVSGGDTMLGYRYDPERAKELLADAGYPGGKGLPVLTLQLGPNEQTASVAEAVQQQWGRIGVKVELRQVDFPQHLEMIRAGKLPLWRTQWVADYCDPENFLALFASANRAPGGPNTTRYANKVFDAMYERLLSPSLDSAARRRLSISMDSLIVADAPWVFLYYPRTVRLLQPGIRNFSCDPLGRFALAGVGK